MLKKEDLVGKTTDEVMAQAIELSSKNDELTKQLAEKPADKPAEQPTATVPAVTDNKELTETKTKVSTLEARLAEAEKKADLAEEATRQSKNEVKLNELAGNGMPP